MAIMKALIKLLLLSTLTVSSLSALNMGAVKDLLKSAHRMVDTIEPAALKKMIDNDEEFVLIDIREPDQLQRGEIFYFNSHKITRGYLEFKVEPLVKDKRVPIVVYCCTGQRSILASQRLMEMGYHNVKSLRGGIRGWVEDGMPLDTTYGELIVMPADYDPLADKSEKQPEAKK